MTFLEKARNMLDGGDGGEALNWIMREADEWTPTYGIDGKQAAMFRKGNELLRITSLATLDERETDEGQALLLAMAGEEATVDDEDQARRILQEARHTFLARQFKDAGLFGDNGPSMN